MSKKKMKEFCNKLVTITSFGICFPNMGIEVHNLSTRQSINNYDKYALELWISTELMPENQFYKPKMKIF